MKSKLKHTIHILLILTIVGFIAGCGGDEEVDELEKLYSDLVRTYELFKREGTFAGEPTQIFDPPEIEGAMTITSDQRITQEVKISGISISASGSFEIILKESKMIIDNDNIDLNSEVTYTWDGVNLITTLDVGTFVVTDYWRQR